MWRVRLRVSLLPNFRHGSGHPEGGCTSTGRSGMFQDARAILRRQGCESRSPWDSAFSFPLRGTVSTRPGSECALTPTWVTIALGPPCPVLGLSDLPSAECPSVLSSLCLGHCTRSSLLPSWPHPLLFTFVDTSSGKPARFHVSRGLPVSLH